MLSRLVGGPVAAVRRVGGIQRRQHRDELEEGDGAAAIAIHRAEHVLDLVLNTTGQTCHG